MNAAQKNAYGKAFYWFKFCFIIPMIHTAWFIPVLHRYLKKLQNGRNQSYDTSCWLDLHLEQIHWFHYLSWYHNEQNFPNNNYKYRIDLPFRKLESIAYHLNAQILIKQLECKIIIYDVIGEHPSHRLYHPFHKFQIEISNLPSVARFGENVRANVMSKIGDPTTINVIILSVGREAFWT